MIYVYRIGNCNHPLFPLPKHQPFAMGDKIRGLAATSQRTQSSRDGQGGDAKKYGPGFSLTSRLRDFDFHPIARNQRCVPAVRFFFWQNDEPFKSWVCYYECWILEWQHWNLRMEAVLTSAVGTTETQSICINFWRGKGTPGTVVMEIEATKMQQLSEEQQQEREERSRRLDFFE